MKRTPMVSRGEHMNASELKIVRYISSKLIGLYCDESGRPAYARSMNRVMGDIFGVKKFNKLMEKALRNEQAMIMLMRRLDINTLWSICRNAEHYRLMRTLVLIDDRIVTLRKKTDKIVNMTAADRPTNKYRKLVKEQKTLTKRYNQCIKIIRDIFDIKSPKGGKSSGLLDYLNDWKRQYGESDSLFSYFDYDGGSAFGVESMEDFIRHGDKKGGSGAFNLFDTSMDGERVGASAFGDDDLFMDDEDGVEGGVGEDQIDRLADAISITIDRKLRDAGINIPATSRSTPIPVYSPNPGQPATMDMLAQMMGQLTSATVRNTDLLKDLIKSLSDDDEGDELYSPREVYSVGSEDRVSAYDAIAMSNAEGVPPRPTGDDPVETPATTTPVTPETPATPPAGTE